MLVELLLQLFFCIVRRVDASRLGSGSGAFWVSPQDIGGHVLTVEVCIVPHVLDGGVSKECVHLLVAVELVRQSIKQAVASHKVSGRRTKDNYYRALTITSDAAGIQAIGIQDGELDFVRLLAGSHVAGWRNVVARQEKLCGQGGRHKWGDAVIG